MTEPSRPMPREESRRTLGRGRCVELQEIVLRTPAGETRTWETAERVGGRGAVLMIAWLRPSERLLLIRQFRPPARERVWEFPAGLIDEGESAEAAAVRELREETGYTATLLRLTPAAFNSPGLTGETVHLALMEIDEESADNRDPQPALEPTEDIEVHPVHRGALRAFLHDEFAAGRRVDSKVAVYILGGNL